jgi:hypothetical protein
VTIVLEVNDYDRCCVEIRVVQVERALLQLGQQLFIGTITSRPVTPRSQYFYVLEIYPYSDLLSLFQYSLCPFQIFQSL